MVLVLECPDKRYIEAVVDCDKLKKFQVKGEGTTNTTHEPAENETMDDSTEKETTQELTGNITGK